MVNHSHRDANSTLLTARIGPNGVAAPMTIAHTAGGDRGEHVDPADAAVQDRAATAQSRPDLRDRAHHRHAREHHVTHQQWIVQCEGGRHAGAAGEVRRQ